jgi:hypothetical protein
MKRTFLLLAMSLALVAGAARAEYAESALELEFYTPETRWRVRIPRQDWVVLQEKAKPDDSGFYYFVGSKIHQAQFSIYLDKTTNCSSGETCRALFWRNRGAMFKDAKGVREYESNGFHVVEFYLDEIAGVPVKQANLSGHMYRDGHWIDVRFTKVGRERLDLAPLTALLDSISVK